MGLTKNPMLVTKSAVPRVEKSFILLALSYSGTKQIRNIRHSNAIPVPDFQRVSFSEIPLCDWETDMPDLRVMAMHEGARQAIMAVEMMLTLVKAHALVGKKKGAFQT